MQGLDEVWEVRSDGGSWSIVSVKGNIIADDIPFGAYADHIADLHNNDLLSEGDS